MSEYLKLILNAFHDMVFVFTKEGLISDYLTTNHESELIQPLEIFINKHHSQVLSEHVSAQINQAFEFLDQGNRNYKFDYSLDQNGQKQWYVAILTSLHDGTDHKYLGAVRNITSRKKTEQELAQKNKELRKLNRQKDKLFSVISHDLKNSIAGSVGAYDMILEDFENFSKSEIHDYLKLLGQQSRITADLLEDLLLWSRSQFKDEHAIPEKLNVAQVTDAVFRAVSSVARQKNIALRNNVRNDLHVYADPNMMKTIMRNLVTNGIKFSHPGGEILVHAEFNNENVNISVTDQGVGMDQETINKVLNKQTTYTTKGTNGERGSGLGLDLCIDFVEKHNGKIWVESQPDQGSTFTFTLPTHPEKKEPRHE